MRMLTFAYWETTIFAKLCYGQGRGEAGRGTVIYNSVWLWPGRQVNGWTPWIEALAYTWQSFALKDVQETFASNFGVHDECSSFGFVGRLVDGANYAGVGAVIAGLDDV